MVIEREMRFSQRFSDEFDVPFEKIIPFFKNEFQLCLIGKADLKKELKKYLPTFFCMAAINSRREDGACSGVSSLAVPGSADEYRCIPPVILIFRL